MSDKKNRFVVKLNPVDLITLSNVFIALISMYASFNGHIYLALSLLFIAALLDATDGILARKWGLERDFGRYLDSFVDVLIYMISPTIILMQWGFSGFGLLFIGLMIASACIRLSVFNQLGNIQSDSGNLAYLGMPVFWSIFIVAGALLLECFLPKLLVFVLLAISLTLFAVAMLLARSFFKFNSLKQIVWVTSIGAIVFAMMDWRQHRTEILEYIVIAAYVQLPIVFGGVLHMVFVSRNYLASLANIIGGGYQYMEVGAVSGLGLYYRRITELFYQTTSGYLGRCTA